ncbi:MAG: DUF1961 family protein [Bryobacteraceae bacterium]
MTAFLILALATQLADWWVEGGERVWVEDGRLHMRADNPKTPGGGVCTVWNRAPHPGDFELEMDAHVVSSSTNANNVNLFFSYSDPAGAPLETTREARSSAEYGLYHKLNGYIVTFLNDTESNSGKARVRIRRNPGFRLLAETFTYHCRRGQTYHLRLTKRGGDIRFAVDGRELLRATDPEPLAGGHFALRTFRTWLWWDNVRMRPLGLASGRDVGALPLPASGYDVYLLGEMHGVKENADILSGYLARLESVRHVALEEDAVWEREAQSYVEGRTAALPPALCLRANFLDALRRFHRTRPIRVRLVDIDSPASAIRQHLLAIAGPGVRVPAAGRIKEQGLVTVAELKRQGKALSELRTIEHSICALQQGFEVGAGQGKGSPYLEDREAAIAANLRDIARPVLAVYGADHVSKSPRRDGGPNRDRPFSPLALRLEQAGLKVYSLLTFPLAGRVWWRGRGAELPYTARDGSVGGQTLDRLLAGAPLLYADPQQVRVTLPSQDASAFRVDGILMLANATPMEDRCSER